MALATPSRRFNGKLARSFKAGIDSVLAVPNDSNNGPALAENTPAHVENTPALAENAPAPAKDGPMVPSKALTPR